MNYWNTAATEFDALYDPHKRMSYALNRWLRRGLFERTEMTCEIIRKLGSPSVLDVGCGSGRNIVDYCRAGASHVTGIDSAAKMLEIANKLLASNGLLEKADLILADFQEAHFDSRYDLVVALGVFDYLDAELPGFLTKMGQLSTGAVVFSAPTRSLIRMPLRALRYQRKGIKVHFYRRSELAELCQAAGFRRLSMDKCHSSGYLVTAWP